MERRRAIWLLGCMFVLAACGSATSGEAQLVEVTTAELVGEAQAIIRGNVGAIRSEWNEERTYIWSFVTVTVTESLKGTDMSGQEIEVKIPGGVVGEVGQISSDQVTFQEGEDVVVFLGQESYQGRDYYNVVRLVQGKFSVVDSRVQGRSVEEFLDEIRRLVGQ